jgi:hypothetical protein
MANEINWNISDFWKNRQNYSLSQIAYLACGLEPKEFDSYFPERYLPETVKRAVSDIENIFLKKGVSLLNLTEWSDQEFDRDSAIRLLNDIGGPNFLLEPEQSTYPTIEPDTAIKDSEREKYLKQIAVLALLLAEKSNKYKRGEKPVASQIANDVQDIVDAGDFQSRGTGTTELRESISKGLKLLTE